ncbi:MAG: spore cortex biosynthesis protein YabQ [Clostridia bacterium]|nr:spore cortex biosynthesis protein YabQ [Clostridia bacterium]
MGVSFLHQLSVSYHSVILGFYLGIIYDIVRIIRCFFGVRYRCVIKRFDKLWLKSEEKKLNRVYESLLMGITDILFFIIIACIMASFIYSVNSGNVRWYIYLFAFAGFLIYYLTLGKIIISLSSLIVRTVKKVFRIFIMCMLSPFLPFKILYGKAIKAMHNQIRARRRVKLPDAEEIKKRTVLLQYGKNIK